MRWTQNQKAWLLENYSNRGVSYCAEYLNKTDNSVRNMAFSLGIKIDSKSQFAKAWHSRSAKTRTGKKRPYMVEVMRQNYREGKLKIAKVQHGLSHRKEYKVWVTIMHRCYNHKNKSYHNYGGRGIAVCEEWKNPVTFIEWYTVNRAGREGVSIDRIDVNGDYSPSNCRFATPKEQASNTRKTSVLK